MSQLSWTIGNFGISLLELLSSQAWLFVICLIVACCLCAYYCVSATRLGKSQLTAGPKLIGTILFGLVCALVAYIIFPTRPKSSICISSLGYLFALIVSLKLKSDCGIILQAPKVKALVALAVIIYLALPIRFWELEKYGRVHHCEQNITANLALRVLDTKIPVFWSSWSLEPARYLEFLPSDHLLADPLALVILIFGNTFLALKVLAVVFGLASIALIFFVGDRWLGRNAGFSAAVLLSLSPYMIGLSREVIYAYGLLLPYTLLTFHFLLCSFKSPRFLYFFISTLLACCSFYLYFPALVLFPFVLGSWLIYFLIDKNWRYSSTKPLLFGLLAACPILLPYGYLMYRDDVYQYAGQLARYMHNESGNIALNTFWLSLAATISKFWQARFFVGEPINFLAGIGHIWGKVNGQHLPLEALLFFIGLGQLLRNFKTNRVYQLLIFLYVLAIAPGFFSSVTERRYLVEQVAFYLITGIGAAFIYSHIFQYFRSELGKLALCLLALVYCSLNYGLFIDRALATPRFYDREAAEEIAKYLNQSTSHAAVVGWSDPEACTIPGLVYYLAWSQIPGKRENVRQRLILSPNHLATTTNQDLPVESTRIRFFFRSGINKKIWPIDKFKATLGQRAGWQMFLPDESRRSIREEIFWLDAPRAEFDLAKDFVCQNLAECNKE